MFAFDYAPRTTEDEEPKREVLFSADSLRDWALINGELPTAVVPDGESVVPPSLRLLEDLEPSPSSACVPVIDKDWKLDPTIATTVGTVEDRRAIHRVPPFRSTLDDRGMIHKAPIPQRSPQGHIRRVSSVNHAHEYRESFRSEPTTHCVYGDQRIVTATPSVNTHKNRPVTHPVLPVFHTSTTDRKPSAPSDTTMESSECRKRRKSLVARVFETAIEGGVRAFGVATFPFLAPVLLTADVVGSSSSNQQEPLWDSLIKASLFSAAGSEFGSLVGTSISGFEAVMSRSGESSVCVAPNA